VPVVETKPNVYWIGVNEGRPISIKCAWVATHERAVYEAQRQLSRGIIGKENILTGMKEE
jgi:hypothetical protein